MNVPHLFGRVAIAAGILLGSLAAQATEFRSSYIHPEDYPTVLAVRHMGETLSKATGGKHSIKVYAKGSLGIEKDTIEQTKLGAIAMTRVNVAPMNNICPATMVPTMPFLFRDQEHLRKVLDGAIGDEILKDCESQGFVGVAFYDSGARSIYTVKKPIKTLGDVKGLKVRVQQSDLWVSLLEAMGARPPPCPLVRCTPHSRRAWWTPPRTTTPATKARATSRWPSISTRPSTRWRPRSCCSASACGTS